MGFGTTGETGLSAKEIKSRAMGELKRLFRPEFLNRIDDIVVFQKLAGESLTKIAELLVDDLRLSRGSFWTLEIGKDYFPVLLQRGAFKVTYKTGAHLILSQFWCEKRTDVL